MDTNTAVPKKEVKDDSTVFERQEEQWLENDCEGSIEDYEG